MPKDVLQLIQSNMSSFSKGQKRIAAFIQGSYDKAAFMTASKLGKTVNVSESTVVRFAAELGYDGISFFQDLKFHLHSFFLLSCTLLTI